MLPQQASLPFLGQMMMHTDTTTPLVYDERRPARCQLRQAESPATMAQAAAFVFCSIESH